MTGRTVVANPGAIPELVAMAAGLGRAGLLRELVLPFDESLPAAQLAVKSAPRALRGRLERELGRRRLPAAIPRDSVRREATAHELLFVAAERAGAPRVLRRRLLRARNRAFDERVSRRLRPSDTAVVGAYSAALRTLRRARELGIEAVLNYSIAHHRFAERLLGEEARRRPGFAPTLQFHAFSAGEREQLDREVEEADRLLVLSTFQAQTFVDAGVDAERIVITPLGVDLGLFRPRPRPADARFRVLFVGQIGQRKGLSYLLEAMELAAIPGAELVLAGSVVGSAETWRRLPNVRHVPHRRRDELPALYAEADVFVLPSLVEGFGLTALEAMACGRPVIVSEHTFAGDIVTDGEDGYVVPIRNAAAIAELLRHLHAEPGERARMGLAARGRAEAFGWDRYEAQIAELFGGARRLEPAGVA